jgi:hypothetical protein
VSNFTTALASTVAPALAALGTPWVARIGSLCLGIYIGFMGLLFVSHGGDFAIATFASLIAAIGGAVILSLLNQTGGGSDAISYYLIGLVVGGVGYIVLFASGYGNAPFPFPIATPSPSVPATVAPLESPSPS